MKVSMEFVKGKNGIGWVDPDFTKAFGEVEITERAMPTFQKIGKDMADAQIESELKPGMCEMGDILSFIKNPPEECKDGYSNLFYTPSFVVSVGWIDGEWGVYASHRDDYAWSGIDRVFSPATVSSVSSPSALGSFDTLDSAIKILKNAGYLVYKQI